MHAGSRATRLVLIALGLALSSMLAAGPAGATTVSVTRVFLTSFNAEAPKAEVFAAPSGSNLPKRLVLNKVGVIKVGNPKAPNVLVLEPGTSAGAAYFVPFAKSIVSDVRLHNTWQVWSVERRENLLEDQTVLTKAKTGRATGPELFCYYLGWIQLESKKCKPLAPHILPLIPKFVSGKPSEELHRLGEKWGMNVAVEDLKTVITAAKALGGKVVLGGHSLGGSVVTAYATWDFAGKVGAEGLSGLVYDDGGSSPVSITKARAEEALSKLKKAPTPWLAFGGIEAPFLGLFSALGSTGTVDFAEEAAPIQGFSYLPEDLKPRKPPGCKLGEAGCEEIPVTNEALFGFGVNVGTSPPTLIAAQVHAGKGVEAAAKGNGLHGWDGEGAITPIRRYAEMLSGTGISNADGSEWYFPERLTIDTGAVAEGNTNPAQEVLGEHAIHGHELPTSLKILAIDSELDKLFEGSTLQAAEILAEQSGIPKENLTLIEVENEYAHNDPAGALPGGNIERNKFYSKLVPYLSGIAN